MKNVQKIIWAFLWFFTVVNGDKKRSNLEQNWSLTKWNLKKVSIEIRTEGAFLLKNNCFLNCGNLKKVWRPK